MLYIWQKSTRNHITSIPRVPTYNPSVYCTKFDSPICLDSLPVGSAQQKASFSLFATRASATCDCLLRSTPRKFPAAPSISHDVYVFIASYKPTGVFPLSPPDSLSKHSKYPSSPALCHRPLVTIAALPLVPLPRGSFGFAARTIMPRRNRARKSAFPASFPRGGGSYECIYSVYIGIHRGLARKVRCFFFSPCYLAARFIRGSVRTRRV